MRLMSFAVIAAVAIALPVFGAPTDQEVTAARLAYIDGDFDQALQVIKDAAQAEHPVPLNILGAAFEDGRGVVQDTHKAVAHFERAAKAGEVRGYFNLGTLFAFGSGDLAPDRARAAREFNAAAEQGYGPAMTALGQLEDTSDDPNYNIAADWYEKGHDAGDVVGTTNLAHAYVEGRGRPENWTRARLLYTEAAARGYPRAFNDLGVIHEEGRGVHSDQLTAFSFFLEGVNRGYPKAAKNLAELIIAARFPFSSKHAALGYCIWAIENADSIEKTSFERDCAKVEALVEPDEAIRARARFFADRL